MNFIEQLRNAQSVLKKVCKACKEYQIYVEFVVALLIVFFLLLFWFHSSAFSILEIQTLFGLWGGFMASLMVAWFVDMFYRKEKKDTNNRAKAILMRDLHVAILDYLSIIPRLHLDYLAVMKIEESWGDKKFEEESHKKHTWIDWFEILSADIESFNSKGCHASSTHIQEFNNNWMLYNVQMAKKTDFVVEKCKHLRDIVFVYQPDLFEVDEFNMFGELQCSIETILATPLSSRGKSIYNDSLKKNEVFPLCIDQFEKCLNSLSDLAFLETFSYEADEYLTIGRLKKIGTMKQ